MLGFKAETDISEKELVTRARKKLVDSNADLIIANDIGKKYTSNTNCNKIIFVDSQTVTKTGRNNKERIVKLICKNIEKRI